jgi:hypothetical protein
VTGLVVTVIVTVVMVMLLAVVRAAKSATTPCTWNRHDVMPGWGNPAELLSAEKNTKDELFISFFSTLHLQLRGKYFILNCGSNFHALISMLIKHGGCGAVNKPHVFCLNEQFGKFRICDLWGNLEECQQKQRLQREVVLRRLVTAGQR